ncbi:MAG: enoyl-CoA hydratase-related protein [Planctomycetota bacterium]|jgi:methylglutaconyl-CoA hydratase
MPETLRIERDGPRADVVLARPDVHNAFNEVVVRELREAFDTLGAEDGVRAVVLRGDGRSFSAGADLAWMGRMAKASREENLRDAEALASTFRAIADCPKVVIARVHGAALGGGSGLTAAADVAVAAETAKFGFTEVRLGIVPAVISEVVVPRIGMGAARTWFTTGRRFGADEALLMGLVVEVVVEAKLDEAVDRWVTSATKAGPAAVGACKRLLHERSTWGGLEPAERDQRLGAFIADLRATDEAQEGMTAFLEKRKPGWVEE